MKHPYNLGYHKCSNLRKRSWDLFGESGMQRDFLGPTDETGLWTYANVILNLLKVGEESGGGV